MKHHYWEAPIVIYLFLGGLGGGIFFLSALFDLVVAPGSGALFFAPVFFALAALAVGCFFLVFELRQPPVFWRVFTTKTAIIKWGCASVGGHDLRLRVVGQLPVRARLGSGPSVWPPLLGASARSCSAWPGCELRHHGLHRRHALHAEGPCLLGDAGAAGPVHRLGALHGLRGHRAVARQGRFSSKGMALLLGTHPRSFIRSISCSSWPRSSCCS